MSLPTYPEVSASKHGPAVVHPGRMVFPHLQCHLMGSLKVQLEMEMKLYEVKPTSTIVAYKSFYHS